MNQILIIVKTGDIKLKKTKCKGCGKKLDIKNEENFGKCQDCGEIFCEKCLRSCPDCGDSPFCAECMEAHLADHDL